MRFGAWALGLVAVLVGEARGHYNMLLPERPWAKVGETVTLTYQWGHPFEHELFDAARPRHLMVLTPANEQRDLTNQLIAFKQPGADGKPVTSFRFPFTPAQRGDYLFLLTAAPQTLNEAGDRVEDVVGVVLHVQTQKNWAAELDRVSRVDTPSVMITPLTRPYGLLPGTAYQGRFWSRRPAPASGGPALWESVDGGLVEWERYHAHAPKELPPDELITFKTRTDPRGVFTCTLPEPGWWGLTASTEPEGERRRRVTLWVHVDEKK